MNATGKPSDATRGTLGRVALLLIFVAALPLLIGCTGPAGEDGTLGPQGDPGPDGPVGAQGSPDTGQQILDKLGDVDGDASGLDADLLDGLDSVDFARSGMRTMQLPVTAYTQGNPSWSSSFRIPTDLVPETILTLHILYLAGSGTNPPNCTLPTFAGVSLVDTGQGGTSMVFGPQELQADGNYAEAEYSTMLDPAAVPGRWASLWVMQDGITDCFVHEINAMAIEYDSQ